MIRFAGHSMAFASIVILLMMAGPILAIPLAFLIWALGWR